ncbi:MAG: ABC transporter substrate-binding protein [Mesorhizobium sp.]|uniref:ABC transporter substrate-binding protein n=1 Tax=Mesorhizobium sp. TaxID=1871066 RepID=UPI000FD47902|nr:ABC transporter substrate-binding protein [Mesorhizobium sp.]RVC60115.1 ABC transporter substrate-binding protein [Mesorhizobium sp. M00.F.Ca.ET.038.03.1.1]RWD29499.1 MAG: ABC transporter substrate-binding protein [Mesorhizobium sp.]
MNKLRYETALAGIAAIALSSSVGYSSAEEYKIGAAMALTGALAPYDQPGLAGFKLGIKDLNAKGGIGGLATVTLEVIDTRSDTAATVNAAQKLIDDGVKFLITPGDADPSIAAGQIGQAAGIPMLNLAGSPSLTPAVGDYMFISYPSDTVQSAALASYASETGYKTAFLLKSPDSAYTSKFPDYFGETFKKKGGSVVGEASYSMGQPDFSAVVSQIKGLTPQPDVIMTTAYEPDFPAFIKQLRGAGVKIPVIESDAIGTPTVYGLGSVVDGVVQSSAGFPTPGSGMEAFNKRFKEETGHDAETSYEAAGYEWAQLLDAAARKAGSLEPAKIRDALASLEDVQTVLGKVTYAGTERVALRDVAMIRIEGGKPTFVKLYRPTKEEIPNP